MAKILTKTPDAETSAPLVQTVSDLTERASRPAWMAEKSEPKAVAKPVSSTKGGKS